MEDADDDVVDSLRQRVAHLEAELLVAHAVGMLMERMRVSAQVARAVLIGAGNASGTGTAGAAAALVETGQIPVAIGRHGRPSPRR